MLSEIEEIIHILSARFPDRLVFRAKMFNGALSLLCCAVFKYLLTKRSNNVPTEDDKKLESIWKSVAKSLTRWTGLNPGCFSSQLNHKQDIQVIKVIFHGLMLRDSIAHKDILKAAVHN